MPRISVILSSFRSFLSLCLSLGMHGYFLFFFFSLYAIAFVCSSLYFQLPKGEKEKNELRGGCLPFTLPGGCARQRRRVLQ